MHVQVRPLLSMKSPDCTTFYLHLHTIQIPKKCVKEFSSNRPCPTCCTSRGVPVADTLARLFNAIHPSCQPFSVVDGLHGSLSHAPLTSFGATRKYVHTFGRLTLGTITLCSALGASLGALAGFPPGWYWYLKSPLLSDGAGCSHGLLLGEVEI